MSSEQTSPHGRSEGDDRGAVDMQGVRVSFGDTVALDGFDLSMARGEILGLLGPNGSGKTTAVKVLATLLRPDEGVARVFGHDVTKEGAEVRRSIAITGQYAAVDELLSGRQNLQMFGRLFGLSPRAADERADELLDRFGLTDAGDRVTRTYSGGMRRRLDLASSLLIDPQLLFLDEPTTGLDPHSRRTIWQVVRELARDGATILLTTQYLDEADELSDRITVMDHGRAIAGGTADELKEEAGELVVRVVPARPDGTGDVEQLLDDLSLGVVEPDGRGGYAVEAGERPLDTMAQVAAALQRRGVEVRTLALRGPDLDDVFLRLTGSTADDEDASDAESRVRETA